MKWLTLLYPPAWRARYESELRALIADQGNSARLALDLIRGAVDAWLTGPRWGRRALTFWGAALAFVATTALWSIARRALAPMPDLESAFETLYWIVYIGFVTWLSQQHGVACDLTRFGRGRPQ